MMYSEAQIQEKHELSVLKTWCVQNLGLTYGSPLCMLIDRYRDSMKPELMSDYDEVERVNHLINRIRYANRVRS